MKIAIVPLIFSACATMDPPAPGNPAQAQQTQPTMVQRAIELVTGSGADPAACRARGKAARSTGAGWICVSTLADQAPGGGFSFSPSVPRSGDAPTHINVQVGQVGPAVQVGPVVGH